MVKNLFGESPFVWVALSALFFGMALSRSTFRVRTAEDPHRARAIKWSFVSIYLSVFILLGLCAVFIPGPEKIVNEKLLYLFGGVSVLSFLAFRFKRSLGSLIFFSVFLFILATFFFLRNFNAFTGETEIAKIKILDVNEKTMRLDIVQGENSEVIITLKGDYFAPIVKEVIFDDYFVFLGFKTWYRFLGVTSFSFVKENGRMVLKQMGSGYYFKNPHGISEDVYQFFEKYEGHIPGVKTVQVDLSAKRARKFGEYSVRIQNDGGIQIVEVF